MRVIPDKSGIYLLGVSTQNKQKYQYAVKVGMAIKSLKNRLHDYDTHTPFYEIFDIHTYNSTLVPQKELYYQQCIEQISLAQASPQIQIGKKQQHTEWFYVSKQDYILLKKKGFKALVMNNTKDITITLKKDFYGTTDIIAFANQYLKGSNSDWGDNPLKIKSQRARIIGRIKTAIFTGANRSSRLKEIGENVNLRREVVNAEDTKKGVAYRFTPQEFIDIITDPTFNPSGLNKQSITNIKFKIAILDTSKIETISTSAAITQPKIVNKTDYKFYEGISYKEAVSNKIYIQEQIKYWQDLLASYDN